MLFNSFTFFIFFFVFYFLYWLILNRNLKVQNILLLIGGYVFYSWTDWRLLFYLIFVSLFNYLLGIYIGKAKSEKNKKLLVAIGLVQGIGGLVFFKYFNFFITSFNEAFTSIGIHLGWQTLQLIIPLGISFFTFRTISYILDINKGKIEATTDWVVYFTYVSYFPGLLSGPIDRAGTLIPQLEKRRSWDYNQSVNGLRQILWGLFKKIAIADNCGIFTTHIFDNFQTLPGSSLFIGSILFTIQLYADFSGYSDMAIGVSSLLGIKNTKNFEFPLFAQNIAEFWRKWHISLTSWMTEYVYTPLSITFRDYGKLGAVLAILINFVIIGMWHGANWTFIIFGFIHGCFFVPLILKGTIIRRNKNKGFKKLPSGSELFWMGLTFLLVTLSFILFKSDSISNACLFYKRIFSISLFSLPELYFLKTAFTAFVLGAAMFIVEWVQRDKEFGLQIDGIKQKYVRWLIYYTLVFVIMIFGVFDNNEFIYFKF